MPLPFDVFSLNQSMSAPEMELYHYRNEAITFQKVQPHRHDHYEFYFFRSGNIKYTVLSRQYHLQPGDFLVIDPGELHYPEIQMSDRNQNYERFVFWIRTAYLQNILEEYPCLRTLWNRKKEGGTSRFRPTNSTFRMLDIICQSLLNADRGKQDPFRPAAVSSLFVQLLVAMNRVAAEQPYSALPETQLDLYAHVIDYIHRHIKEAITLDDLSSALFVSKGYISRVFREHLGISVHQYILRLKTDNILNDVKNGATLSSAAEQYGFSSYSSFYRHCMNAYGVSPKEMLKEA